MVITVGTLIAIGLSVVVGGGVAVNEVQNHTIGNALKEGTKLVYNTVFAITEWNVSVWKHLFEGEVTDNDLSSVTDELELTPLAEQARLALNLSTKNVHGMVDFSMWRLKLPSDSVIIDYPVDIPKNNGVIIFPKPHTVKPKVEGVPATPETPRVIIDNPPKVPDFTGFESFPAFTGDKADMIMSVEGDSGTNTGKPNQVHHYATNKSKTYTQQIEDIVNKYGLDLDDEWNMELLPHQGRHPNAYHEWILEQLRNIDNIANGNQDIFLDLYESEIKNVIRENPDMLYSDYWNNLK